MAALDVIDETFVLAARADVAAAFADPEAWPRLWPDLGLTVFADRGEAGIRWSVTGRWVGSAEVWCEPVVLGPASADPDGGPGSGGEEGTLLHWFLRVDPAPGPEGDPARRLLRGRSGPAREALRRQRAAKEIAFGLKDALERGRRPGEPAVPAATPA
ncbi:polyketide cyclase / dehydrase and lipid transport [Actinomycetospora sp. TBRC 11914]|uniref:polyketide cyclase / dehydrase and lipid transport n=1 Tax=Actinomycetospora sp. TBRC 11914 TaxID=2729387 RepID=UPI00145F28D6|nr:polyketide cyclase / dehydrase and lipid transport [Actinomycetospora sp. TBRC 11914]NMO93352.1 polyketide cyclase / dehydrase and lipid transport [Actinomycetospora sp. TBRC 11914]